MPIVTFDTELQEAWELKLQEEAEDEDPRGDEIHVSDLTGCLRQGVLAREFAPQHNSAMSILRWKFGRAFEKIVFKMIMIGVATEELEVRDESIVGHIDFASDIPATHCDKPHDIETKLSWKYVKDDPNQLFDDNFWYLDQAGSYAVMRRRTCCLFAVLHIQPIPQLRIYHVEWTREELGDLWFLMIERRKHHEMHRKNSTYPERTNLVSKFCDGCAFNFVCYEILKEQ